MRKPAFWTLMIIALCLAAPAHAQRGGRLQAERSQEGGGGISPEVAQAKGLFATGLEPVFPSGVTCPGVSSPFGSSTRFDGSARRNEHFGLHNGLDITLPIGTPLLAMADGEVVHAGTAGRLVGNFIWLRFAPAATGLPETVFTRYQHLDQPSPLPVGSLVRRGQVIGVSGNTGTDGGHYGLQGYAHLHLNMVVTGEPTLRVMGANMGSPDSGFLDPLGVFITPPVSPLTNHVLRDLPPQAKRIAVAVTTTEGQTIPATARIVWPVACSR